MIAALIKLGFSELAAQEFTDNGITALNRPRTLSSDALDMLIKQIHRDNQGQGLFISFNAQQHIRAIRFWTNRRHIIGQDYTLDMLDENRSRGKQGSKRPYQNPGAVQERHQMEGMEGKCLD
jgi:hypothetical protein